MPTKKTSPIQLKYRVVSGSATSRKKPAKKRIPAGYKVQELTSWGWADVKGETDDGRYVLDVYPTRAAALESLEGMAEAAEMGYLDDFDPDSWRVVTLDVEEEYNAYG